MSKKGVISDYTSVYTPAQNRINEAFSKYIIERLIYTCNEIGISIKL